MKIYISGPMTGMPGYNYKAFNEAEYSLTQKGYLVVNPASLQSEEKWTWADYLKRDIITMLKEDCVAIAVLDGWQKSKGAMLEVHIGKSLGMQILEYPAMKPFRESVLTQAHRLVHGDRGEDYGHPYDDFIKTCTMWTGLFWHRLKDPVKNGFKPEDVPLAMNCVKLSREVDNPKEDNRIDGPGYWETADMVHQRKKEMQQ